MPIRRPRLNREEQARNLACLEQLRTEGIDVEIPEEWKWRDGALDIILASPAESTVRESRTGGIHYAILLRLAARSRVALTCCDIATSWDDQVVLESFLGPVCKLGEEERRQCDVLNHRIESGLRLCCDEWVEGWLLATGLRPVPAEYGDAAAPFEVIVSDPFGREFRAEGSLSVCRAVRPEKISVPRGTSLYDLDATQRPRELSVSEASDLRYRELIAQEQTLRATQGPSATRD